MSKSNKVIVKDNIAISFKKMNKRSIFLKIQVLFSIVLFIMIVVFFLVLSNKINKLITTSNGLPSAQSFDAYLFDERSFGSEMFLHMLLNFKK